MNDPVILTVLAVLVVLAIVVAAVAMSRRHRRRLSHQFGPEYDHAVSTYGRRRAAKELDARRQRVEGMPLRELSAAERAELVHRWQAVQTRFVDQPAAAVADADALIGETMRRRGYDLHDVADERRREADLSVGHPHEVGLYRQASEIARRSRRSEATTEELRQAMVHYRTLFERLSGAATHAEPTAAHAATHGGDGQIGHPVPTTAATDGRPVQPQPVGAATTAPATPVAATHQPAEREPELAGHRR